MPLDAGGKHRVVLEAGGEKKAFLIQAAPVAWPQSILKVAPKYVAPPREVQEQIARDAARSKKALASRTERQWTLPLHRPVPGGVTSPFGGRRVFNGQPRAPHKGTDMRSPEGANVKAAADGVVLLAEKQYFGGNSVYIDHGQGVVSTYAHLSSFDVKAGERVRKGQVIGRSGSTGRVTGPHLHFGLLVQGVAVDAMPLLQDPPQLVGGPSRSIFDNQPKAAKTRSSR
ncbi:MAG TPA: M23 family metallopeptidase [Mailhella massiliensis]|uniref:M23 family metallopeptidase n=2 Tax=Mailhella massiliensis TaxID=1903261 RepID=A0A921AVN6_9BACT|nr:M23 family metallopeptidase [Mailhella massiliensis]